MDLEEGNHQLGQRIEFYFRGWVHSVGTMYLEIILGADAEIFLGSF